MHSETTTTSFINHVDINHIDINQIELEQYDDCSNSKNSRKCLCGKTACICW